jgi:hypothetical protein
LRSRRPLRAKLTNIAVPEIARLPGEARVTVRVLVDEAAGNPMETWLQQDSFVELVVNGIKLGDLELKQNPTAQTGGRSQAVGQAGGHPQTVGQAGGHPQTPGPGRFDLELSGTLREPRDLPLLRSPPFSVKATFRRDGAELEVNGFDVVTPG